MAVEFGDVFKVEVDDGGGGWYIVNDMNTFNKTSNRTTTKVAVFQRVLPYVTQSTRDQTYSISGFLNPTDAGQNRLRAAEAGDLVVNVRITHDGTNGFQQPVKVSSFTYDADPENLQEIGFDLEADDVATIVGTGPLM